MTIYNPRNFLNVACVGCFFSGERVENCSYRYRYRFDLIDCGDWFLCAWFDSSLEYDGSVSV